MIWFLIIGLCLGVFIYLASPLYLNNVTPENVDEATQKEISAYRNELRRIEQMIADEDGDVSVLTAEKRVLERKLIKAGQSISYMPLNRKPAWIIGVFAVLISSTLGIYGAIGSPELTNPAEIKSAVLSLDQASSQNTANVQHENTASMDELISGLEEKLQAGSQNPQEWGLYARSLMATNRFEEAFVAYENTLSLTNNNPQVLAELENARAYAAQQTGAAVPQRRPIPEVPGPNREDIEAAAQMDAEDRNVMIQGMVDGLSMKLADNPDDPTGWVRLLKARQVLGQLDTADEEISLMKAHFKDDPDTIAAILNQSDWKN